MKLIEVILLYFVHVGRRKKGKNLTMYSEAQSITEDTVLIKKCDKLLVNA